MFRFAVNDGGELLLGVLRDAFPDAHHVAAGGVHQLAAFRAEFFHDIHLRAKGRDDHHVVLPQLIQLRAFVGAGQEFDVHRDELLVDFGVVDDLAEDVNRLAGEDLAGGVRQVNRAFDAVAKTKFLRQPHLQSPGFQNAAVLPEFLDDLTPVMLFHLFPHRLHDIRAAQVHAFRLRLFGDCFHAHAAPLLLETRPRINQNSPGRSRAAVTFP